MTADTVSISPPIYVTDNQELAQLCEAWLQLELIALDTEFVRVDTFYPRIGLIQVGDGVNNYLLDPLKIDQWDSFIALLAKPTIIKVLHSCSEDLVVFKEFFNQVPTPMFDSQKAAAFLGLGYSISYQNLVKEVLDVEVSKDQTRSDWTRRPLTQEQCNYAALDVAYLPSITKFLQEELVKIGRLEWLQQECEQMLVAASPDAAQIAWRDYYLSLGGAWRLKDTQLEALQRLCEWREQQARSRNKPRSWIAKDAELIAIADALPKDKAQLSAIADLPRPLVSRDGDTVLSLVAAPHTGPAVTPELIEQPLDSQMRKTLKQCQSIVRLEAERLDIAPELLARKKQLLPLIGLAKRGNDFDWPAQLGGWRRQFLETSIRKALSQSN